MRNYNLFFKIGKGIKASIFLLFFMMLNNVAGEAKNSLNSEINDLYWLSFNQLSQQQNNITVRGIVSDEKGEPIPGVTIIIDGSTKGVITDIDGNYSIDVRPTGQLSFSFVGMEPQTIKVNNQTRINVVLKEKIDELQEVTIVGFGKQKKESVVASVTSVKGKQLQTPARSLSNSLAGQLPGLISVQRSGEPGYDNAEFWIRGVSSFAGGTNPLVLVDGVPRNMNDIEPDEIETFTLLKDAAATSVYGSEGANGVVLITSKRGKIQKTSITYRGEVNHISPTRIPNYANSYDYLSFYNLGLVHSGEDPLFTQETLNQYASGKDLDLFPSTNWWKLLLKDHTNSTRHTLNFRGGIERARYFVSGAFFNETGLFNVYDKYSGNSDLNRYNLRSNIDIDITRTTLLKLDLSGQYLQANRPIHDPITVLGLFSQTPPHIIPYRYSDGKLSGFTSNLVRNPYNELTESGYRREWRSGIQSKVEIEQGLDFVTKGLKMRGAVSYDANSIYYMTRSKRPETYKAEGRDVDGNLLYSQVSNGTPFSNPSTSSSGDKNIYIEGAINYNRTFGKHTTEGMMLYYQKDRQLHNEALAYRKQAWVGRANYSFDNRYILEANFSVTGSEQFAKGYRYGFFPAVGLAWNVTNEPLFPESWKGILSQFRIRASMGKTGNDNTGSSRFLYRPTFVSGSAYEYAWGIGSTGPVNGVGEGIVEGRFESPSLSWEIEVKRNYGIDLYLFNDKINIQADYFDNERTNILLQRRTVSGVAGFRESPWQNFGKVSNKGIDGSVNMYHKIGEVSVALRGNFTFARNKILEYDEIPQPFDWMQLTGTRLNGFSGKIAERLYSDEDFDISTDANGKETYSLKQGIPYYSAHPNPKPGDIKYKDLNGDGVVDDNFDIMRDIVQPAIPEIMYGFGINIDYKGAYVNVFFQGAENVSLNLLAARSFIPFYEGLEASNVRQEIIDSHWTKENPSQNVLYPRITHSGIANTNTNSTWWYRDASFIRLKNVELGYNLPKKIASKAKLNQATIYIMGQNVALWDKVKLQDPELGSTGGGTQYPLPRTWSIGLELSF